MTLGDEAGHGEGQLTVSQPGPGDPIVTALQRRTPLFLNLDKNEFGW